MAPEQVEVPQLSPTTQIKLPLIEHVDLSNFTLFQNKKTISLELNKGVFCLAGANGLGKSSFLAALNFGLTGIVPDPDRRFDSVDEYYRHSIGYSRSFFSGRIAQRDRDGAEISLRFVVGTQAYEITRSLFEPQALVSLRINGSDELDHISDGERHAHYASALTRDAGLDSFEQFVFLQLFLFTFDERRHLLFWDEKVHEQVLYLAFGIDPEKAKLADQWRRQAERADSQARNLQYQATVARQELATLRKHQVSATEELGQDLEEHEALLAQHAELNSLLSDLRVAAADADKAVAQFTADLRTAQHSYEDEFDATLGPAAFPSTHPLIVRGLGQHYCELCGTNDRNVSEEIDRRLKSHHCPLCDSVLAELPESSTVDAKRLQLLSESVAAAQARVEEARSAAVRLQAEVEQTQTKMVTVNRKILELQQEFPELGITAAGGTGFASIEQKYLAQIEDALSKKAEFRLKRNEAQERLKAVQHELTKAYVQAEERFVPRFTQLAREFLGLSLDIQLEGARLSLSLQGTTRRSFDQLSESQRFFVDIALRMALTAHIAEGASGSLYVDTPEGSLDIAYEARAGDMFGLFAQGGHRLIMTANINTSQLLLNLARRAGSANMRVERMTEWVPLSDVQAQAETLFDSAFEQIENALAEGK